MADATRGQDRPSTALACRASRCAAAAWRAASACERTLDRWVREPRTERRPYRLPATCSGSHGWCCSPKTERERTGSSPERRSRVRDTHETWLSGVPREVKVQQEPEVLGDARHALHAHVCRAGTRTRHSRATVKAARHTVQGCVHDWESMGRLLRPGTCAKITHIELRIEHRAPRLLPARCDADAWSCLDFQALGRRRGHDDPCVDGGSAMYEIRIFCRALQESTRPNRHPGYGKLGPGFQPDP